MILIRVQYDAYNRRFDLLDRKRASWLEDGETYLLIVDSTPVETETEDFIEFNPADMAHA